jgi:hypothetical protein
LKDCGFCSGCGYIVGLFNSCCGCSGCDSELYWSEWHNDPPRCCDPCDHYGNWIGPYGGNRAPYYHPYSPHGTAAVYAKNHAPARRNIARSNNSAARTRVANQQGGKWLQKYPW